MKDKFRENFHIAFPAALASLALILVLTLHADVTPAEIPPYNLIQIIPYVLVLIGGIIGINVFVVLLIGIVSGAVIALATGATGQTGILAVKALLENMGSGAAGMFETSMVAILVSAICALIREYGGFEALLRPLIGSERRFAASAAARSAWAFSSARWTLPPRTTPSPSLWQTPSPRR